ncbi:MAG: hypothetical protein IPM21_04515 [Acidobacteria bacterium]|nr:hypothetical protein [Acidobacteriota bacterium]
MAIRAIVVSIALLLGLGTLIPLATEYAEAGSVKTKRYKNKKKAKRSWRGVKKYSKRWWQLYRAQERRKRQVAQRRRALRLRQVRLARARQAAQERRSVAAAKPQAKTTAPVLPSGAPAPKNWSVGSADSNELKFNVAGNSGSNVGSASISVVGAATGDTSTRVNNRTVGGIPTTALRRDVINKMIKENGWVVNDYQKLVGNDTVYVVVAQSQARDGRVHSRLFYFTEAGGRVYSVATNSATDSAERLAEESEKVIQSLRGGAGRTQQAAVRD